MMTTMIRRVGRHWPPKDCHAFPGQNETALPCLAPSRSAAPSDHARSVKGPATDALDAEAEARRRALEAADIEGLRLERSDGSGGYKGVSRDDRKSKPFKAHIWSDGRLQHLGCFAVAEEAALAYVRAAREKRQAAGLPEPGPPPPVLRATAPPSASSMVDPLAVVDHCMPLAAAVLGAAVACAGSALGTDTSRRVKQVNCA